MDFSLEQRLAITQFTIELTNPSESYELVERRSRRDDRFSNNGVLFDDNGRCNLLKIVTIDHFMSQPM